MKNFTSELVKKEIEKVHPGALVRVEREKPMGGYTHVDVEYITIGGIDFRIDKLVYSSSIIEMIRAIDVELSNFGYEPNEEMTF